MNVLSPGWRSRALCAAGVVALLLLMVLARVIAGAGSELRRAEQAKQGGYPDLAVTYYARALEWYAPGLPAMQRGRAGLLDLARAAEERNDPQLALQAYGALRSALYASRSFYTPGRALIAECDRNIARLLAATAEARDDHPQMTDEEREQYFLEQQARFPGPSVLWSILAELGFIGWVLCAALFVWRAGRSERRLAQLAWRLGLPFAGCYALWLIALYLA